VGQYIPQAAKSFDDSVNEDRFLLWFHHEPWDARTLSGRTVWDEMVTRYDLGVSRVVDMRKTWDGLSAYVDPERYRQTATYLRIQENEARWWRDACIAYFQSFSKRPLPAGHAAPEHPLAYYEALSFPFAAGTAH
jgi:alpha-glucuronidase